MSAACSTELTTLAEGGNVKVRSDPRNLNSHRDDEAWTYGGRACIPRPHRTCRESSRYGGNERKRPYQSTVESVGVPFKRDKWFCSRS